ncbi:MAG: hypothetical protein R2912_08775 [Eubacteriales bacterium]
MWTTGRAISTSASTASPITTAREDNDLIMAYDSTWLSLNGQIVAYYLVADQVDENYTILGMPAMLNDERVNIILRFDAQTPYGTLLGAQYDYGRVLPIRS